MTAFGLGDLRSDGPAVPDGEDPDWCLRCHRRTCAVRSYPGDHAARRNGWGCPDSWFPAHRADDHLARVCIEEDPVPNPQAPVREAAIRSGSGDRARAGGLATADMLLLAYGLVAGTAAGLGQRPYDRGARDRRLRARGLRRSRAAPPRPAVITVVHLLGGDACRPRHPGTAATGNSRHYTAAAGRARRARHPVHRIAATPRRCPGRPEAQRDNRRRLPIPFFRRPSLPYTGSTGRTTGAVD